MMSDADNVSEKRIKWLLTQSKEELQANYVNSTSFSSWLDCISWLAIQSQLSPSVRRSTSDVEGLIGKPDLMLETDKGTSAVYFHRERGSLDGDYVSSVFYDENGFVVGFGGNERRYLGL
jgi:hypothetical protein